MVDVRDLRTALNSEIKARDKNVELFLAGLDKFLATNLRKILRQIQKGEQRGIEAAKTLGGIQSALKAAGLEKELNKITEAYADELDAVRAQFALLGKKETLSEADRPLIEALIEFDTSVVASKVEGYVDNVRSTMMRGIIAGEAPDFMDIHEERGNDLKNSLNTELRTAFSAFNQAVTTQKALDVGFELFLYLGPDDKVTREFCHELLMKEPPIYTAEEIGLMDNGQISPVMIYGGGYNCRHQWRPVSEELAREMGWEP